MSLGRARAFAQSRLRSRLDRGGRGPAIFIALGCAVVFSHLAGDWIAGLGVLTLWLVWTLLAAEGKPPVLRIALSFQWVQVTCGIYYFALTGREVEAMYASDYRPMVLIGLGCVVVLAAGLALGIRVARSQLSAKEESDRFAFTWKTLLTAWLVSILAQGVVREVAWQIPMFTQGILAVGYLRLGIVFLVFRRLVAPRMRWTWFLGILTIELGLGFTGYFAGFREPIVLAALAFIEAFDRRSPAHWARLAWICGVAVLASVLWMGIRTTYRQQVDYGGMSRAQRLETVSVLSSQWFESGTGLILDDFDQVIERIWAIYYPALAVARVPEMLPHEDGALMWDALKHIVTPRFLFPDKGFLASDSEFVRKYTGILVAGADENTSIAFGYAAEAYVDFGIPMMFLPALLFGVFVGVSHQVLLRLIRHRELSVALICVVFWMSLYLFERSWVKTLGLTGTLLIYVGAVVWLIDRQLERVFPRERRFRASASMTHRSRPV